MSDTLSMFGHIDDVFESVPATRTATGGAYVDGIYVPNNGTPEPYVINTQPATDREIDFIRQGGERITEVRRIYINQGNMQLIDQTGLWSFLGQAWKAVAVDNRYWRNYCRVMVVRIDPQSGGPA